jgi:hypothetical protein
VLVVNTSEHVQRRDVDDDPTGSVLPDLLDNEDLPAV